METLEKSAEVVSNLIELNNDRVDGFEKALKDLGEGNTDLKSLFEYYSQQSRRFSQELAAVGAQSGADTDTGNSVSGTLHRAWIDVKALFTGNDREAILNECERGEDVIKKAYRDALAENSLTPAALQVVTAQSQEINQAHDRIKALRDSQ